MRQSPGAGATVACGHVQRRVQSARQRASGHVRPHMAKSCRTRSMCCGVLVTAACQILSAAISCVHVAWVRNTLVLLFLPQHRHGEEAAIVCCSSPGAMSTCTETISWAVIKWFSGCGTWEFFGQGYILWTTARELSFPQSENWSWATTEFQKCWFWGKVCLKVMTLSSLESPLCAEILLKKEH